MQSEQAIPARAIARAGLTRTQWLICIAAGVGFLFDTYEMVVHGLIVRPALLEVANLKAGTAEFNRWVGMIMYLPWLAGGLTGLVAGNLTDRFGRRRILVWSIVLYGVATIGAGLANTPMQLLIWRALTIIGVCAEFVAATAWITESFSERKAREAALGFTQACAGAGIFCVAIVYYLGVTYGHLLPPIRGGHAGWRYALLFGALPVIPILVLRTLTPESPQWQAQKTAGALPRPRLRELFTPEHRHNTLMLFALSACITGLAQGTSQQMPRIVPGLAQVMSMSPLEQEQTISFIHLMGDIGGTIGRVSFAILAMTLIARRNLLRTFQIPALVLFPLVFAFAPYMNVTVLACGVLLYGCMLNGMMSFLGNYTPQMYPLHLRGTGQSFTISVGGRAVGASASMITANLASHTPGANPSQQLAFAAAIVAVALCTVGVLASRKVPEPKYVNEPR